MEMHGMAWPLHGTSDSAFHGPASVNQGSKHKSHCQRSAWQMGLGGIDFICQFCSEAGNEDLKVGGSLHDIKSLSHTIMENHGGESPQS